MLVARHQELIAWQLADQFKKETFRLLRSHPEAWRDFRFRGQLADAARSAVSNIVEGFKRFSPPQFANFLDYSLASLAEAEQQLRDCIDLGYFTEEECVQAFRLARRCLTATIRLKHSQRRIRNLRGR